MKIKRRTNGIYLADYTDPLGRRKRVSLGTRDKAEAERKAANLMTGRDTRSDVWLLSKALEHCYSSIWQHQKSWETRASLVKLVSDDMGHLPVGDVTYEILMDYVTQLYGEDRKPATINRRLATIGKALREAAKLGKLAAVPPIPLQPENNKRTRWLTDAEERTLLAHCNVLTGRDMEKMQILLPFLLDTGARLGEALRLGPEQVQENPPSVRFLDTKSKPGKIKHRTVPLTARAFTAARKLARLNHLGGMLNKDQLERRLDRVRQAAGLPDVTFHTLRHTCASRLVQRGAAMHEVRDWLGHSSIVVTERYAHLAESSLGHLTGLLSGTHNDGCSTDWHTGTNLAHFPPGGQAQSK